MICTGKDRAVREDQYILNGEIEVSLCGEEIDMQSPCGLKNKTVRLEMTRCSYGKNRKRKTKGGRGKMVQGRLRIQQGKV